MTPFDKNLDEFFFDELRNPDLIGTHWSLSSLGIFFTFYGSPRRTLRLHFTQISFENITQEKSITVAAARQPNPNPNLNKHPRAY